MQKPSLDNWLKEVKKAAGSDSNGMYLIHNGVVRSSSKASVTGGGPSDPVISMDFSYSDESVAEAIKNASAMEGITCVKVWLNSGTLKVGDDLMFVLVGGDTRPHVFSALQTLVSELKTRCVTEKEIF